ncbi:hypothetical protein O0I10_012774 [Lichtheimia ornata]|uniref:Uncharacterized protein n=1 Tax=Lichtheimia ornata TaxID=688661 RepID=A0AAD7UQE9_9FUNG|nr:uncharacterized protein O0I10_012774 [Lichtheimia ornata]KAJ8651657.1 hypothetical protein O0I10_012774 [Lichtheimia ornata]
MHGSLDAWRKPKVEAQVQMALEGYDSLAGSMGTTVLQEQVCTMEHSLAWFHYAYINDKEQHLDEDGMERISSCRDIIWSITKNGARVSFVLKIRLFDYHHCHGDSPSAIGHHYTGFDTQKA